MRRVFDFLRFDDLPMVARRNYAAELPQITLWGIVAGTIEGSMASVVASKTFGASELLTTIVWALPVLMFVLNVVWGVLLRGRSRKPAFMLLAVGGLTCMSSIGLTSNDWAPWGGWLFAAQIAGTHLFLSGLINLRTTMWKVNYPASHRARIAGRLQTVRTLLVLVTAGALSMLYNLEPEAYRLVYPGAAAVGLLSLWPFRRLRMRGEKAELRRYHEHAARTGTQRGPRGVWAGLREIVDILRTDTLFARFMLAQFLLGAANFFTDPILVNALTKDLDFDYFSAQALMDLIPQAAMLISIRFWAPVYDRVGILRFRVINSLLWVAAYACVAGAMLLITWGGGFAIVAAWPILVVGRLCKGIGWGGGRIAWNIGHLHFAREHQTELYMGIHVALTGLRALVMPLVGLGARQAFGYGALLIAVGLALLSHILFRRLARSAR